MTTMTHLSLWRWLSCHRPQHTRPQPLRSDRTVAKAVAGERRQVPEGVSVCEWLGACADLDSEE